MSEEQREQNKVHGEVVSRLSAQHDSNYVDSKKPTSQDGQRMWLTYGDPGFAAETRNAASRTQKDFAPPAEFGAAVWTFEIISHSVL